jgi:hypothetical protein
MSQVAGIRIMRAQLAPSPTLRPIIALRPQTPVMSQWRRREHFPDRRKCLVLRLDLLHLNL